MLKVFTVVLLFFITLVSCKESRNINLDNFQNQIEFIEQPDKYEITLPQKFVDKGFLPKELASSKLNLQKINESMDLSRVYHFDTLNREFTKDQIDTYLRKHESNLTALSRLKLVSGYIIYKDNQGKYKHYKDPDVDKKLYANFLHDPKDNSYYGFIEWTDRKIIFLYGRTFQVSNISYDFGYFDGRIESHRYQAVFSEDFNQNYEGKGLHFILGSYLVQKYYFNKDFGINLVLDRLSYIGKEFPVGALLDREPLFAFTNDIQSMSKDIPGFGSRSFSLYYTDHQFLKDRSNNIDGVLGTAYIGALCLDDFKSAWVTGEDYLSGNSRVFQQYTVDSHEISHLFGAQHESMNKDNISYLPLMNERVLPLRSWHNIFTDQNADIMLNLKYKAASGSCLRPIASTQQSSGVALKKRAIHQSCRLTN